jgi:uncharacterized lipoprotein YmbA
MKSIPLKTTLHLSLAAVAGPLLFLAGCSVLKPKADLTQFYVLRSGSAGAKVETRTNPAPTEVRIGPGRLANYLEATPIAVQDGANGIKYLDLHHWAEPLTKGLSRILGDELCQRLNLNHVTRFPDPAVKDSSLEIRYTVNRWEGTLDGPVTLDVYWQLVQQPSGGVISGNHSVYEVTPKDKQTDVAAYVRRLSDAAARWANDLATAIRSNP